MKLSPPRHGQQTTRSTVDRFYHGDVQPQGDSTRNGCFSWDSLQQNKVALITGGGGGIGIQVAKAFAEAGADVAIWYHSSKTAVEHAADIASHYDVRAKAYQVQVTDKADVDKAVAAVEADFGRIDICVINHGIPSKSSVLDGGVSEWKKVVDINYNGAFYVAFAVGELFKNQNSGNLIFTGSMSGRTVPNYIVNFSNSYGLISIDIANYPQLQGCYNSTKAALIHLAKSLALEWAPFNVRVNSVSPGYMHTKISKFVDKETKEQWYDLTPMGRDGDPRELKGAYLYLASDASTFTTGTDIIVVNDP